MNPSEDATHDMDLVEVFQAAGATAELEAMGVSAVLDANGIPNVLSGSSSMPNLPFSVMAPQEVEAQALAVIEEAEQAGPEAAEEGERAFEASIG